MHKRIVHASNKKSFVLFWMSLGFSAGAYFGLKYLELSGPSYYVFAALLAVFLLFAFYYLGNFALGLPKITANGQGITLQTLFLKKFWPWEECGRFFLSTLVVSIRSTRQRQYFVCAFTRRNQQAIDARGAFLQPDHMHADIKIPLNGTKAGASEAAAAAFVDDLNRMLHEQTGHLRSSVPPGGTGDADALQDLERTRRRKHLQYGAVFVVVILIGIAGIILRVMT